MLVEVVLEPLVGEVDAELFEAVVLIILKAKDVQDSNGQNLVQKTKGSFSYFPYFLHIYGISYHKKSVRNYIYFLQQHCKHQ